MQRLAQNQLEANGSPDGALEDLAAVDIEEREHLVDILNPEDGSINSASTPGCLSPIRPFAAVSPANCMVPGPRELFGISNSAKIFNQNEAYPGRLFRKHQRTPRLLSWSISPVFPIIDDINSSQAEAGLNRRGP